MLPVALECKLIDITIYIPTYNIICGSATATDCLYMDIWS